MRGNVEDISELLYKTPTKHTIVFIKEKMKCAQTLEYVVSDEKTGKTTTHNVKHNIGVVVERKRSGDKDEQNDSFTIQGLLGRLCGYEEHDCICYTNLASFEKYEKLFASNFNTKTLKRVSWNSNTTHGKGEGKGTSVHPTVNDDCVDGNDGSDDDSKKPKRNYELTWILVTPDTWNDEWSKYCGVNGFTPSDYENPFDNAIHNISPSGLWRGGYRGWKILKCNTDYSDCPNNRPDKLFECNDDAAITPVKELPTGSTGSDKLRKFVCYNSKNQLGVFIAKCVPAKCAPGEASKK
jgi:hypothetical protein